VRFFGLIAFVENPSWEGHWVKNRCVVFFHPCVCPGRPESTPPKQRPPFSPTHKPQPLFLDFECKECGFSGITACFSSTLRKLTPPARCPKVLLPPGITNATAWEEVPPIAIASKLNTSLPLSSSLPHPCIFFSKKELCACPSHPPPLGCSFEFGCIGSFLWPENNFNPEALLNSSRRNSIRSPCKIILPPTHCPVRSFLLRVLVYHPCFWVLYIHPPPWRALKLGSNFPRFCPGHTPPLVIDIFSLSPNRNFFPPMIHRSWSSPATDGKYQHVSALLGSLLRKGYGGFWWCLACDCPSFCWDNYSVLSSAHQIVFFSPNHKWLPFSYPFFLRRVP